MLPIIIAGIIGSAFAISVVVRFLNHKKDSDNYISKESLQEALLREGRQGDLE
jgi:hypothetical protein